MDLGTVLQKCESSQISVQTSVHCLKALIWNDAPVKPISYGNSTSSGVWCSWVAAASNAGGERQGVSSGDPWRLSPEPEDTWNPEIFVQEGMETQNQLDLWKPFRKSGKSIKPLELCLLQVEKGELQTHALELNGPGRESCSCHRPHCGVWEMLRESLMSPWGVSIDLPGNEDPPTHSRGHPADQVKLPPWTMSAEACLTICAIATLAV